eukprot:5512742-Ditylum_brightwellii.AAC.1
MNLLFSMTTITYPRQSAESPKTYLTTHRFGVYDAKRDRLLNICPLLLLSATLVMYCCDENYSPNTCKPNLKTVKLLKGRDVWDREIQIHSI